MVKDLNERAWQRATDMAARSEQLRLAVHSVGGTRVIDCGVQAIGGLEAGRRLADICLAGLARVTIQAGPKIVVDTDQPLAACMASQYAGWQLSGEKFFGMGSGPMRAAYGHEEIFGVIDYHELATRAVGVIESSKLPTEEICALIADKCAQMRDSLTLLVARTASLAGTVQIVARSLETALHKLHVLGYDITHVHSGYGAAPLPPVAADDLVAIGRTNDAILYGGEVTLWVSDDDAKLQEIGPQVPSSASKDFGEPFSAIFERYGRDFYKIDPMLFSPAVVTLNNLRTGKAFRFGQPRPDILDRSFSS